MDWTAILNQLSPLVVIMMTWLGTFLWRKYGTAVTGIGLLALMAVLGTVLTILNNLLVSTPDIPIIWQAAISWLAVFISQIIKQGQPEKRAADNAFNEDAKLNPPPVK